MKRISLFTLTIALLLSACGSKEVEVHEPWTRTAVTGETGVVYMILHNHSDMSVELLRAVSDVAEAVELHKTTMSDEDVMQMIPVTSVPLAPGEEVEFEPGGLHIMLVNLNRDLNTGEWITLTLHFKNYADITLSVPILNAAGDMDGSHQMP